MARVVAALFVLVVMVAGCGDDDGGGAESASKPAPKSDASSAKGTGYTLQVPEDFRDLAREFEGSAIRVDLAYAQKSSDGFATNIVVIREQPGGDFKLQDAVDAFTKQAESQADDEGISGVEDREIDGVEAKTWAFQRREGEDKGKIRQRQVVAVKDGGIYTITWSVAADAFEAQEATLDEILASWRWT